jgi:hypothetical protein
VRRSAGVRQSLRCVGDCRGLVEIQLHRGRKRVPLQRSDSSALPTDPRPTRVSCSFFLAQKVAAALDRAGIARKAVGERRPLVFEPADDEG